MPQPNRRDTRANAPAAPRRIAMLAFPDCQVLDVVGPLEVFSRASRLITDEGRSGAPVYDVEILGPSRSPLVMSSGIRLCPDRAYREARGGIDTLLVAGGRGTDRFLSDAAMLRWLRARSRSVRRVGSICTGAFVLAEAGLLDGLRATTHWASCDTFAARYPGVSVDPEPIFVRQGPIWTSAGVTAGMDLALAMVEEDHGRDAALAVAKALVLFLRRTGGQSQFSSHLSLQLAERDALRDLQAWIVDHPAADLSAPALARRVHLSPRHFARLFTREVGTTPAKYVTVVRVDTARRMLEEGDRPLEQVCVASGFGDMEAMRRAFLRHVGVPPGRYRRDFGATPRARSTDAAPARARSSAPTRRRRRASQ